MMLNLRGAQHAAPLQTTVPETLEGFHQLHAGETCLVVCNGPSIKEMPVDFLQSYPSIGCNTIFEHETFRPWYWVACDSRVMVEFGDKVMERLGDVPKFIPKPNLDKWQGPNFYRWYHRPGLLWPYASKQLWPSDLLGKDGITYACSPHVMMQLAYFMGFTTILVVGMDHTYHKEHFWGVDEGCSNRDSQQLWDYWEKGHRQLCEGFAEAGVAMINITPGTKASEDAIPHGDWLDWYTIERAQHVAPLQDIGGA